MIAIAERISMRRLRSKHGLRQGTRAGVIAISALTLVPGVVGGSETYVRELLRGLARVGTTTYRVLLPPAAEDAGDGLPTVVVERQRGNRLLAMARAAADPRYSRLF